MADSGIQPPYLDPSQYPNYLDLQRKQQLAQMLTQTAQQSAQTPQDWNSMRVVPKRSPLMNVTALASALMAGGMTRSANQAQQNYFQGLMGGGPSSAPAAAPAPQAAPPSPPPALAPPPADPNEQSVQPLIARNGQTLAQALTPPAAPAPQPAPRNPMIPPGMAPATANGLLNMMGPAEYGRSFVAPQFQPTDIEKQMRAANIDPASPMGQSIMRMVLSKATTNLEPVRQGTGLYNANTGQFDAYNPATANGSVPTFQGGQPAGITVLPGAVNATEQADAAAARGKAAGTPTIVTGSSGAPIATFPAAGAIGRTGQPSQGQPVPQVRPPSAGTVPPVPGAPPLIPPPSNHIMTPTEAKANEGLASQAVTNYQSLNDKGTAAVNAMRNLSEMKNLLQGFNPGMASGALATFGNLAISAGMDPQRVAQLTNVDPGNVEAFEKNTAALASEVVKEFTNRTTQMEFATFMKNNPNPLMSANGLKRVIDFMDKGFGSTIDQQQEAQQFWQANATHPERFVTDFPAYYNAKKAADIKAGKFDSINPSLSTVRTRSDVNAAAASQGVVKVTPGTDIQALKQQHPAGTVFEFPDGSRGKL